MNKIIELAWAAGFIDGEGSIGFYKKVQSIHGKKYTCHYLRLSVANTDKSALYRLKDLFGGSVHKSTHAGRNNKDCWTWYCQSNACADALERLLPYLFVKRQQTELALESRKFMRKPGQFRLHDDDRAQQERISAQLKALKAA